MNIVFEVRDAYLYVQVIGVFSSAGARGIFLEWLNKARDLTIDRVLCDITLVTGFDAEQASTMTKFAISEFVAYLLPKGITVAILETSRRLRETKFIEDVMVNRGVSVRVVSTMQEALEWLGVPLAEPHSGADEV